MLRRMARPPSPAVLDSRGLTAAIALGTLGALMIMMVPGFVMLFGAQSGLDDRRLGFVASWDINATAATIGLSTFLITRMNWRVLALIGMALMLIGNAYTAASHDYLQMVIARVGTGLGEGFAIAVSFAALGSAAKPDRAFGIYLVVGLTVSAALLAILPALQAAVGSTAIFCAVAALALMTCAVLPWLPSQSPALSGHGSGTFTFSRALSVSGLAGVFLYFIAQGALWSYFERIGAASAVAPASIGEAMGLSSFAGVGGALLAVFVASRFGRLLPLVGSGVVSILSFWMLRGHVTATALIVAGILFNFAWNLAQPLLSGVCAEADSKGRVVVAMGCIQTIGFGLGPALAATVLAGHDFSPVVWLSTAVLALSLLVVFAGVRAHGRRESSLAVHSL